MFTPHSQLFPILQRLLLFFFFFTQPLPGAGWYDAEEEIKVRFHRGVRYLDTEQYELALAEFQTIYQQFPESERLRSIAQYYIGIVYQEKNRLSQAAAAYKAALVLNAPPDVHGTAHLQLGIVYKTQGQLRLAEKHLSAARTQLPENADVHIQLGDVYLLQRQWNAAENAYRESIRLNPNYTESYYGLGRATELQNRLKQAVEYYNAALKRNPYLAQAHYRLALIYRQLGDTAQAKTAIAQFGRLKTYADRMHQYREALYKNPNLPMLYIKLAELHESFDNLESAARVYQIAITVHPKFLPAYHQLGELFIRQRALEKAIAVYRSATEIRPDDAQAWLQLGVIYINQKRFQDAIQAFQTAISVDSTEAEAYNNLARVYAALGKELEQAIALAEKAVALAPTAKHYDTLAYAYYRNQQYPQALTAIHRAVAIAPNVAEYRKLLLKIQTAQKAEKK